MTNELTRTCGFAHRRHIVGAVSDLRTAFQTSTGGRRQAIRNGPYIGQRSSFAKAGYDRDV
jgi:hypothetical protein